MSDKLKVIVNADDLGLNRMVNGEVERLHQLGVLSSATIMANGPAVQEVVGLHQRNPRLGLGIHLNGTNLRALTSEMRSSPLCDNEGNFNSSFRSSFGLRLTRVLADEWSRQIDFVRGLGIELDHIDSHHHVHTWPLALPALDLASKRSGLRVIRNTRNFVSKDERKGFQAQLKYGGKSIWSFSVRSFGMRMTQGFCSVHDFALWMQNHPNQMPMMNSLELMCHPGDTGNLEYLNECAWLEASLPSLLNDRIELVNFCDLAL